MASTSPSSSAGWRFVEKRQASAKSLTVQDVAAGGGFWHFSQFSSDYRKLFGESPSQPMRAH